MRSKDLKINQLLENLEDENYNKAVSNIEFLVNAQKQNIKSEKSAKDTIDVEAIVNSLIGVIPDTGKSLEEYRNERLKKYEISD